MVTEIEAQTFDSDDSLEELPCTSQWINDESESKSEGKKKLCKNGLDDFRFYSNAPERNYEEFGNNSQLNDNLLRLILCSKRMFDIFWSASDFAATNSSFRYVAGDFNTAYYTHNITLLTNLFLISNWKKQRGFLTLMKFGDINHKAVKPIIKLSYFCKRHGLDLTLNNYFYTKTVLQVQYELRLYTDRHLRHYYGVDYKPPEDPEEYYELTLVDKRGEVMEEERRQGNPELEEFFTFQKLVLVKDPYLAGFFQKTLNEACLSGFNYLTIHEYLPLPSMPQLSSLQADIRNYDICSNSLQILKEITLELHRVAPICKAELRSEICINSRTFDQLLPHLEPIIRRVLLFKDFCRELWDYPLYLECHVDINLPLSEYASSRSKWTEYMSSITEYYNLNYQPNCWNYGSNFVDPPPFEGRNRIEINVWCRFHDHVLQVLGEKEVEVLE